MRSAKVAILISVTATLVMAIYWATARHPESPAISPPVSSALPSSKSPTVILAPTIAVPMLDDTVPEKNPSRDR
jgi:hypothetical protein